IERDIVLVTPGAWHFTTSVDVRLHGPGRPPEHPVLHIGATAAQVRLRGFDDAHARLTLDRPLPLRVGDRAILRDPGTRALWGVRVLDPAPPALRRRGAGGRRGKVLAGLGDHPDLASELARRGIASSALLRRIGVPVPVDAEEWIVGERAAT